jgi:arabinogalactan oligomer / maltooligosaccharide transport system permease protein
MTAISQAGTQSRVPALPASLPSLLIKLLALCVLNALALFLIYRFIEDQIWFLVGTLAIITIVVNVINLWPGLYPLRWMSPAIMIIILLVIYPLVYTVYVAFTNYGSGHILTKAQVISQLEREKYLPTGGRSYSWTAYTNEDGEYALWLVDDDGDPFFITQDDPLESVDLEAAGLEPGAIPDTFRGYERLNRIQAAVLADRGDLEFGEGDQLIGIRSTAVAGPFVQRYTYDATQDMIVDRPTGQRYFADSDRGLFVSQFGERLDLGYWVTIGFTNFERFLTSPALAGPLIRIFLWTMAFAFLSVITTFALGLFLALVIDDALPMKRYIMSLLIIPYAIPAVISVLIWRGLFNPTFGVVTDFIRGVFGTAPNWLGDPLWAKIAILFVNLWLGYPYMMLICSGALRSIPSDIYEAARVDGANVWQQFHKLTLPLLLVAVGPLLIASFTYNFNNFGIIEAFNEGGPPMTGTTTPAGHTDILISYTYRLAFGSGRGADYGYASAITIIIFLMVAMFTIFQFRFTRQLEEISENV